MHSFLVFVLGSLFVSFRPSSLRFPPLFHECFPSAFTFGLFRFPSGSFRPLLFRLRLLGLCFFFSLSSRFRLTVASSLPRFCFRFFGSPRSLQPDLSCFPSRFRYSASCLFPFALPCFAPTAVPQVLPFCFRLRAFPLPFRFLSSPSSPLPATQLSDSSFPSLPGSASQLLSRCAPPLSLLRFPLSVQPDLSCLPSRFSYSAFCLFPFALP